MRRVSVWNMACVLAVALGLTAADNGSVARAGDQNTKQLLRGRIVAIGIPGASAVSAVGTFLPGGPIHDNPAFAAFTMHGRVLDSARILVMHQDGTVGAIRKVRLADGRSLGNGRLNGIAGSPDGSKIWVTVTVAWRAMR